MDAIKGYLPQSEGWLPLWLVVLASISIGNSIQAYSTVAYTKRVYSGAPNEVTPLSARTFGTWTFVSAVVRIYAAYFIHEQKMYELAFAMLLGANFHFMMEWLVFKTARWGPGLSGPIIISSVSIVWMWTQWDFYVKA